MARPGPGAEHGILDRYLLDGESILTAVHQHWAKVAEPVASTVAGLALILWVSAVVPGNLGRVTDVLWWVWFALVGRMIWKLLEWRHDWFVATDKRLLLTYGLITRKVAMMPLTKVTDMSYNRSPAGRTLGYGRFVMESAGQDQALRSVDWVPDPDHTYRAICAQIFGVDDHDRVLPPPGADGHGQDDPHDGVPPALADDASWGVSYDDAEPVSAVQEVPLRGSGERSAQHRAQPPSPPQQSTAIPVRGTHQDHDEAGRSVYRSPDLRESDTDETGPIPPYRPDPTL